MRSVHGRLESGHQGKAFLFFFPCFGSSSRSAEKRQVSVKPSRSWLSAQWSEVGSPRQQSLGGWSLLPLFYLYSKIALWSFLDTLWKLDCIISIIKNRETTSGILETMATPFSFLFLQPQGNCLKNLISETCSASPSLPTRLEPVLCVKSLSEVSEVVSVLLKGG